MGTFHHDKGELHGITVVVDTSGPRVFIGRCDILADEKIILDIHPEVSDLSTQSTVQGGVIINTSEADTRVMVDDGQTAVIGGLIRNNEGRVRTGVPFLMDIPILGGLFSSISTVKQQRELIIFVTPHLIRDDS